MVESQKEADILVESLGTNRLEDDNTETKIATVQQQRLSQREDSTVINEQGARGGRSIITSKGGGGDIMLNMEIKINNEYASLVPELTKEEYESLKESIKQNGIWVPLIVNQDGVLLDGHHRYKACKELGIVEPHYIVKEVNNKYDEKFFVIDCNLKRRQLNNFQKVELALKGKLILVEYVSWR
jgi:ParB-like nuclease family protein